MVKGKMLVYPGRDRGELIECMLAINAYYREHGTCVGCQPLRGMEAVARLMDRDMKTSNGGHDVPYPDWMIEQERARWEKEQKESCTA